MANKVAARLKDGDLLIAGGVNERLPSVFNGLKQYFPFDGTENDMFTGKNYDSVMCTGRDKLGDVFPSYYNYANAQIMISGKVMCHEADDWTKTTGIGFQMKKTDGANTWLAAKRWALSDIRHEWKNFTVINNTPSNYGGVIQPWWQIDITAGTPGYRVEYRDITYTIISNPNIITNNTVTTNEGMNIHEKSTNYIENGDFRNGLFNWMTLQGVKGTAKLVTTPFGAGIEIIRDSDDPQGGNWSLRPGFLNTTVSAAAGDTFVWSFKYKTTKGSQSRPFKVGWWLNEDGWKNSLPVTEIDLFDGWKQGFAPYTFVNDQNLKTTSSGINSQTNGTGFIITDIRLERRSFPTETSYGTRENALVTIPVTQTPSFSYSSKRKEIFETSFTGYGITKDENNNFKFYKNGVETTEYAYKWSARKVLGVGIRLKTREMDKYTDPVEETLAPTNQDRIMYTNLSTYNGGVLFKIFLYCTADVTIYQVYQADNYGAMRVNNGPSLSIGGYDTSTNPTMTVELKKGWNMVEISYMDGDVGGNLMFASGTRFTEVPEIIYMTAKLPADIIGTNFVMNEKANYTVKDLMVYDRVLTATEMKKLHSTTVSITASGDLTMKVRERLPYIPSDVAYFPLDFESKQLNGNVVPDREENTVYEDGFVWIGEETTNLLQNGDGKITDYKSIAGNHAWDPVLHRNALGVASWSTGFNSGVSQPDIGYHAFWARGGIDGDDDPCVHFIDRNDLYGIPGRWLGISQGMSSPNAFNWTDGTKLTASLVQKGSIIDKRTSIGIHHVNVTTGNREFGSSYSTVRQLSKPHSWEKYVNTFTVDATWDKTQPVTFYTYGNTTGPNEYLWVDNMMLEKKPFASPFTAGTRPRTQLQYNLYRDYGLDWSKDWSIVFFKKPVGGYGNMLDGYSLESIGCNGNNGGGYVWFGKSNGASTLAFGGNASGNAPMVYSELLNKVWMVSLVKSGTNLTLTYRSYDGITRTVQSTLNPPSASYFVTPYGYDFKLGGWDNTISCNGYFRDLIVAKRALSDDELNRIHKTRFSLKDGTITVQSKVSDYITLS